MLKFNNAHIFTGYLKQKLSTTNIPACKIYTQEFADYAASHGKEDPRVVESTDTVSYREDDKQSAVRINYLKGNEVFNYYDDHGLNTNTKQGWLRANNLFYDVDKNTPGLTKTLRSRGGVYDTITHEYLGEYLRFLRDYYGVNLMSLYNCFNNSICNNLDFNFQYQNKLVSFSSYDNKYKIYALPVKLFSDYTIAIDCHQGVEIFCGLYGTHLYNPNTEGSTQKDILLAVKTYIKTGKVSFNQPILFDKLNVKYWTFDNELKTVSTTDTTKRLNPEALSRWDIMSHEQDLKMFIKVPVSCRSSIAVLEGDYRNHNNARYLLNSEKNLVMSGCGVGDAVTTTGNLSTSIKDYKISEWQFGHYAAPKDDTNTVEGSGTKVGLVMSSIYCLNAPNPEDVWTQDTFSAPSYSEELDCCLISTPAELAYVVKNDGKTTVSKADGSFVTITSYRLTNDIYINDPTKIDWTNGSLLSGVSDYTIRQWPTRTLSGLKSGEGFAGVIDGNGHVVHGLYSKSSYTGEDAAGLIPVINVDSVTVIKNLGINYAYLRASYTQAFVGTSTRSAISYDVWTYEQNRSILNFEGGNKLANNLQGFKPISKLQLLEFNTGESYPFADRLVEYMCGSAITPTDEISDNIRRAQRVMKQNQHHFRIEGLWEAKMQKIAYDYILNSGPVELVDGGLVDRRRGYHHKLGHTSKSMLYDILGYVDKDVEKWYASVKKKDGKVVVRDTIKNVDIYDGLYEI